MQRPIGVTLTTILLAVSILLTVPVYLSGPLANRINASHGMTSYTILTVLFATIGLMAAAGIIIVLWFYFHGHSRAKFGIVVLCLICFVPFFAIVHHTVVSPMRIAIFTFRAGAALLTLLSLMTPSSQMWFASDPDAYEDPRA